MDKKMIKGKIKLNDIQTMRVFSKTMAGIFTKIVIKKNIRIHFGKLFL